MKEAARTGDAHHCSMVTCNQPHQGHALRDPGGRNVMFDGANAAVFSQLADCTVAGALMPDVVTSGSATVWIGGLPAARKDDPTAHGGTITGGTSRVMIGGPSVQPPPISVEVIDGETIVRIGRAIVLESDPNDPMFQARALAAYLRLSLTAPMQRAMAALDASGHTVRVREYRPKAPDNALTFRIPNDSLVERLFGASELGADSRIEWNPKMDSYGQDAESSPGADIVLSHETFHATHNATGTDGNQVADLDKDLITVDEERNTVGLPARTYENTDDPKDPMNGTALPDTRGGAYNENEERAAYEQRGIVSGATDAPPVQRTSYCGGGEPF